MCGIIGAVSVRDISKVLIEGLRRLEYRGYDSAGVALIGDKRPLACLRMQGKVACLAEAIKETPITGSTGIAHTRWATHGKPNTQNAHPHVSQEIAVVHNGIIENHEEFRPLLQKEGYQFLSETDTEVAAHLIHLYYQKSKSLLQAVQEVAKQLKGAFALAVIHEAFPHTLVAISRGCPLVVGVGIDEHLIASDVLALAPFVQSVLYLEDGDSVSLSTTHYEIFDSASAEVTRQLQPLDSHNHTISKGSYKHFMLKEIHEQPRVLADALKGRIESQEALRASIFADTNYENIKQIHIIACGTSYHAGLVARLWLESLAGIATQVEVASEFRYRDVVVMENTLFLTISQSGETADTLAALEKAKKLPYAGYMAICNVATSTLVRQSEIAFLTRAGVEIGVASTKAFTTQLAALLMLAAALSPSDKAQEIITELESLPAICERVLQMEKEIAALSQLFLLKSHTLFVGRGVQYPVALEGALKLKEISYIHAEAYPAGELKHGPLALIDKDIPVIAIASKDILLDKLKSNIEEVSARGGQLVILMEEEETWKFDGAYLVRVPHCGSIIAPIVYTLPLQLLAYYVAVAKGTDVDQPRNLAKSVTVE